MNSRLRLGPPKVTLPHISGSRIRPSSLPSGLHTVTPLYPTGRPALLAHQRLPKTSARKPSGPHFTPSTMQSVNTFWFDSLLSDPTSRTWMSPLPAGPVLETYSFLKSGEKHRPLGFGTLSSGITTSSWPLGSHR